MRNQKGGASVKTKAPSHQATVESITAAGTWVGLDQPDPVIDGEQYLATVGWLDDQTVNAILQACHPEVASKRDVGQHLDN